MHQERDRSPNFANSMIWLKLHFPEEPSMIVHMDTLTHALSGMLVARASYHKDNQLPLWVSSWAGFFVAAFPDIDFISRFFGITAYLNIHRGVTHSVLMIPVWGIILAWLLAKLSRHRYQWQSFLPVCLLSLSIHIFGDVITAYGTEVLAPFSDLRISIPTTFIIDPYFTGIILLGILSSVFLRQHARHIAFAGVIGLMGYILLQGYWMRVALQEAYASLPVQKTNQARVDVLPQPLSPFNWKIIISTADRYYIRYINIYRRNMISANPTDNFIRRVDALYTPVSQNDWYIVPKFGVGPFQPLAKKIWENDKMKAIRRFMEYPAVYQVDQLPDMQCIWFADQRFVLENIRAPFIFGACQHRASGQLKFLRLADGQPQSFD
jgi:inner membrane protein